jgi:hypothetical protein
MRTFFVLSSALFKAIYANVIVPSNTPSSADPTITKAPQVNFELLRRQNDQRFMGWLSLSGGSYASEDCDVGGTVYQTDDRWRCCPVTANGCDIPVGCVSGSLIYSFASSGTLQRGTYACTDIYTGAAAQSWTICNTGFLYENTQDPNPQTNIFCSSESLNWSVYRVKPEVSTSSRQGMKAFSILGIRTNGIFVASTPSSSQAKITETSSFDIGPADSTDVPSNLIDQTPKKKSNAGLIAGAVVGPVVGIALIGILAFFCLARRKKNKTAVPPPSTTAPSYLGSPQTQPPQPYNNYPPPMQQNQHGLAPYGVQAGKHDSWATAAPVPVLPYTQGSTSPQPIGSPYGAPLVQQQYPPPQQAYAQNPSMSPEPAPGYVDEHGVVKQPYSAAETRPFSSELDGNSYQSTQNPPPPNRT